MKKPLFSLGNKLLVLVLFTYGLWLLSMFLTPSIDEILSPDTLIFTKNLSLFYWFSFVMLLIVIVFRLALFSEEKPMLDFLIITCFVLIIYGTTSVVYHLPIYVDTYIHTSASLKILLRGHTPPPLSVMAASNDPGAYLLYSIFMLITSIDSIYFMKFYPFVFSFIMLSLLYMVSSKFTGSKTAVIALTIYVAFYYFIIYVYPGGLSHILFLLFIYLFVLYMETKDMRFAFLSLPITMAGMTIYILFPFLIILPSIILILHYLVHQRKRAYKTLAVFIFIFIIAWISWLEYLAQGSLYTIASMLINAIKMRGTVELPEEVVSLPSQHIMTLLIKMLINAIKMRGTVELPEEVVSLPSQRMMTLLIKIIITAFEILSGIIVILWGLVNIKDYAIRQRLLVLAVFFIVCVLGIGISAFFPSLTLGAYIRFYWFSLIPFSILISFYLSINKETSFLRLKKFHKILDQTIKIMLIVFLSLVPIIIHDNDPGYYYPYSSLKGADFAVKNLKGNVIWVKYHVHLIEYMALRNGILFEGYMDVQGNETTKFISLPKYMKMFGNELSDYDAVIFNDYEYSLDILSGHIDSANQRVIYEQLISQKLNMVYFGESIRIYAK